MNKAFPDRMPCPRCRGRGSLPAVPALRALERRFRGLPVVEMAERGWLGDVGDGVDNERCSVALAGFFGVADLDALKRLLTAGVVRP